MMTPLFKFVSVVAISLVLCDVCNNNNNKNNNNNNSVGFVVQALVVNNHNNNNKEQRSTIHFSSKKNKKKKNKNNNVMANTMMATISAATIFWTTTSAGAAAAVEADAITGTPLETAIIQMSDSAYPVFSSITDVSSLSQKVVNLLDKKISPTKMSSALDKGIDSFLAIPDDKVANFVTTLKSSYGDDGSGTSSSCTASIPTPPTSVLDQFASSEAVQSLDTNKVKSLQEKFAAANQAIPLANNNAAIIFVCHLLYKDWNNYGLDKRN